MVIIGENLNATIPRIRKMILARDGEALAELALAQEQAGAHMVDVNVGTGEGSAEDEAGDMRWLVGLLKKKIGGSLCIDSADVRVLEAGLREGGERVGLVNSVKATDRSVAEVMPLAAGAGVPLVALAMDEKGIPADAASRLRACERIAVAAERYGVPLENVYFDPLVMPVSTDVTQGMVTLETLQGIKREFPRARSVLALSNVSFGLPRRTLVNRAMLHMAMYLGVDAALINPLDGGLMDAVRAGEVVAGRDRFCRRYTRAFRK
ncbi:MAG: methyltetrahydrofolate cobalamin methyltransferase [Thermodesulfovibrionales bacterium]